MSITSEIIINGESIFCKFDYKPSPPTSIKTATGIVWSLNPGTLALSIRLRENQEKIGSTVILKNSTGTTVLTVTGIIQQSANGIVFEVGPNDL